MSIDSKFWEDCYAEGNTGWDRGGVHPALMRWLTSQPESRCDIIVPGCGRGYEVVELAKRGFRVTAIDYSTEPVQHLRNQLASQRLNGQVIQSNLFDFQPQAPVDVVYEQTCLCAIEPELRENYERSVFEWLKPEGELIVLFAQRKERLDNGPPFHCDLERMKVLFQNSRWQWPESATPIRYEHPSGKLFELAFQLKKIASN